MPKKKAAKKGAKIIDGVATNEMTREQLMGHVKRIQMELDREREERNFFMLEREKLFSLWTLTLEQLTSEKNESRLMTVKMCEKENETEDEMNRYKQKLRYMLTEQGKRLGQVRLQNLNKMRCVQNDMWTVQETMREGLKCKNKEIRNLQTCSVHLLQNMQMEQTRRLAQMRKAFTEEIRRLEAEFDRKMFERKGREVTEEKDELIRTQLEKLEQVNKLVNMHENQLTSMKGFYNDITVNNFAVIAALQQELADLHAVQAQLQKELDKSKRTVERLRQIIFAKEQREKTPMRATATATAGKEDRMKQCRNWLEDKKRRLDVMNEAVLEKSLLLDEERSNLRTTLTHAILQMQKQASMKRLVLELQLNQITGKQRKSSSTSGVDQTHDFDFKPGPGDYDPNPDPQIASGGGEDEPEPPVMSSLDEDR